MYTSGLVFFYKSTYVILPTTKFRPNQPQLFSAPANLRYGHFNTNSKIAESFDPITCGTNWNNPPNNPNCLHGLTNKERQLLELVNPTINNGNPWQWPMNLKIDDLQNPAIAPNGLYYCSNCPNLHLNNPGQGSLQRWWYMA